MLAENSSSNSLLFKKYLPLGSLIPSSLILDTIKAFNVIVCSLSIVNISSCQLDKYSLSLLYIDPI